VAMFQGPGPHETLGSERVVVSAPMSFAGSTQRILIGTEQWHPAIRIPVLLIGLPLVWAVILIWYMIFGLLLVPYRLLRRGSRKRKRQGLQHREMLNQMQYQAIATHAAIAQQTAALQQPASNTPSPPPAPASQLPQAAAIAPATVSNPAAWHPDPTGRYSHRYWDGTQWTVHVAAPDGTVTRDPGATAT
jgi:hypothetical protein